ERRHGVPEDAVGGHGTLRARRAGGERGRAFAALDHDAFGELLPHPGDGLQAGSVAARDGGKEGGERHAGEHAERGARSDAFHLAEQVEERPVLGAEEAEGLDRVLAHLGVDEETHRGARGRQIGEGLERDLDRVAHAADVEHEPLRALLAERARERGDHAGAPAARARATRAASGARCRWQRASASASAASGAGGRARPRRSATPRPIARLSACPKPTVASFTLAGAYSAITAPAAPHARSASRPRRGVTPTAAPAPPPRCPCSTTRSARRRGPRALPATAPSARLACRRWRPSTAAAWSPRPSRPAPWPGRGPPSPCRTARAP